MNGPLSDIRVLDISTVLAGPNCARYFADFGADVIKVERPDTGDSLRGMAWRDPRDGSGLWWKLVNRNKRNIALDLKDKAQMKTGANTNSCRNPPPLATLSNLLSCRTPINFYQV
jgi:crotonobetainyl-CoA:carnitine CoA-transferase CaiB-like acyl-CoA transferase